MGLFDTLFRPALPPPRAVVRPPPPSGKSRVLTDPAAPYWVRDDLGFTPTYGTGIDYSTAAGDLGSNGIIMACIGWLMRAEPEAPWRVQRRAPSGTTAVPDHALLRLLQRPNDF